MKNIIVVILTVFSLYSCKDNTRTKTISIEKNEPLKSEEENTLTRSASDTIDYVNRGLEYALSTQAILGKNLMQAIEKGGTVEALAFCNEQAYPLTDSMAVVHNVRLKRVSDQPRNIENIANTEELNYIENYKKSIANQVSPEPLVINSGTDIKVYYPLVTNAVCLQCHGKASNIEARTRKKLTILYPKDKALDYDVNELRGIWRVTFNN